MAGGKKGEEKMEEPSNHCVVAVSVPLLLIVDGAAAGLAWHGKAKRLHQRQQTAEYSSAFLDSKPTS